MFTAIKIPDHSDHDRNPIAGNVLGGLPDHSPMRDQREFPEIFRPPESITAISDHSDQAREPFGHGALYPKHIGVLFPWGFVRK